MTDSLLGAVFQRLHAHPGPVLWHFDCAQFPDELSALLTSHVLTPTTDAEIVPVSRMPSLGFDLEVCHLSDGSIVGIGRDDESPVEVDLSSDKIRRYAVDLAAVVRELRAASGLRGGVATRFDDGLLPLGERPASGGAIRVYLAAPVANGEDLLVRCRRLNALHPDRRVTILTFCPVALDVKLEEEFGGRLDFQLLPLRDAEDRPSWSPIWPGETQPSAPLVEHDYVFRPFEKSWEIVFAGRPVPVTQKLIGYRYLHYLISRPGEPVAVEVLLAEISPHPDQISSRGKVTVLPSATNDTGPSAAVLKRVRASIAEREKLLTTAAPAQRAAIVNELNLGRAYLLKHDKSGHRSGAAGQSKRVGVASAISRALESFPLPMRQFFEKPRLSLGYTLMYLPSNGVDWVTK